MTTDGSFARRPIALLLAIGVLSVTVLPVTGAEEKEVFFTDFDGIERTVWLVKASFSGVRKIEEVQGFAAVGFKGRFLRNNGGGNPGPATILSLTGLPPHEWISIKFLLALIDTWDGSNGKRRVAAGGTPNSTHADDYFNVMVDGLIVFSETFFWKTANAQSYDETKGTLLSRGVDLGFNEKWHNTHVTPGGGAPDLAYDMGLDSALQRIPHNKDRLVISFFASGSGWQGSTDESWAIDNLKVVIKPASRIKE